MPPSLTTSSRPFLTAQWENLVLLNYAVDPARLESRLPEGLCLDLHQGKAYVSLVAFDFMQTKVLGISWPGFRNFPEINLRFYVRYGTTRGVMFIREYVPKRLIAWTARALYNEPYRYAPMESLVEAADGALHVRHALRVGGKEHTVSVIADPSTTTPAALSEAHFFKEHSWGFGISRWGRMLSYEVRHPVWATHRITDLALDWDWGVVYGDEWADLNDQQPDSKFLAVGSEIAVAPKRTRQGLQTVAEIGVGSSAMPPTARTQHPERAAEQRP